MARIIMTRITTLIFLFLSRMLSPRHGRCWRDFLQCDNLRVPQTQCIALVRESRIRPSPKRRRPDAAAPRAYLEDILQCELHDSRLKRCTDHAESVIAKACVGISRPEAVRHVVGFGSKLQP